MAQQSNHLRLFCIGLVGLICLFGCDQKTTEDSAETLHYEIDKPYYSGPLRVRVRVSDEQAVLSDLLTLELSAVLLMGGLAVLILWKFSRADTMRQC